MLVLFLGVILLLPPSVDDPEKRQDTTEPGESLPEQSVTDTPASRDRPETAVSDGKEASFSENIDIIGSDKAALTKAATDELLGDLLSRLERLQFRAIDRWGGQPYLDMLDVSRW